MDVGVWNMWMQVCLVCVVVGVFGVGIYCVDVGVVWSVYLLYGCGCVWSVCFVGVFGVCVCCVDVGLFGVCVFYFHCSRTMFIDFCCCRIYLVLVKHVSHFVRHQYHQQ